MIKVRARRFLAVGSLLALCFTVLAGGPYESKPPTIAEMTALCRSLGATGCMVKGLPSIPRRVAIVPAPTRLATNGVPGCVRGSNRPVLNTTTPTFQATFATAIQASFELAPLDGSEESTFGGADATAGEPVVWQTDENGLAPGRTYRWRITGAPSYLDEAPVWSEWCEFTVAAGLVDLRPATDVATVRELRVDPARRYPVTLTVREWRIAIDGLVPEDDGVLVNGDPIPADERSRRIKADIQARIAGHAAGRRATVILTGDEWASVASSVADGAAAWDETFEEDPQAGNNGPRYWRVLDRISAGLGGPAHPGLGWYR